MDAKNSSTETSSYASSLLLVFLWLTLAGMFAFDLFKGRTVLTVGYSIPAIISGMLFLQRFVLPLTLCAFVCALVSGLLASQLTVLDYQLRLGWVAATCSLTAFFSILQTYAIQRNKVAQQGVDDAWDRVEAHIEDLESLARHLMEKQEQGNQTISRELHDNVAQVLAAVKARIVLVRSTSKVPSWLKQELQRLQTHLDAALSDVRILARELRPALLNHCGLAAALQKQSQDFHERTNIDIELRIDPDATMDLDPEDLTHLFRLAQESMQNIEKHSGATRAWLRLQQCDGHILLEVGDNGRSFTDEHVVEAQNNGHLGLIGMRERAELLGGSFDLRAIPSRGTTIRVVVPSCSNDGESDSSN